jgi:hypothetical protein
MTSSSIPPAEEPSTVLFRPSKKRKIYRQRARDDDEEAAATVQDTTKPQSPAAEQEQSLEDLITSNGAVVEGDQVEGTAVSISEILRLRKRNKRVGGLEFKVSGHRSRGDGDEQGLVLREEEGEGGEVTVGGTRRFAPQTGTVADVNKHM